LNRTTPDIVAPARSAAVWRMQVRSVFVEPCAAAPAALVTIPVKWAVV
jgi:hypothetical protein